MRNFYFFTFISILLLLLNGCGNPSGKKGMASTTTDLANKEKVLKDSVLPKTIGIEKIAPGQKKHQSPIKRVEKLPKENIESDLPDFAKISNVTEKKRKFFSFMRPSVIAENNHIIDERNFVANCYEKYKKGEDISGADKNKLKKMAANYRIEHTDFSNNLAYDDLMVHVDIIPAGLALTQAALESAWGTSYFSRKVNNIFGQWCFEPGCGVVPRRRPSGETYEVMVFDSVSQSVRSYMLFLNSHPFFSQMRQSRLSNRKKDEKPSAYLMAGGLSKYSARGDVYVNELRSMIKTNTKYMGLD